LHTTGMHARAGYSPRGVSIPSAIMCLSRFAWAARLIATRCRTFGTTASPWLAVSLSNLPALTTSEEASDEALATTLRRVRPCVCVITVGRTRRAGDAGPTMVAAPACTTTMKR
jgi:hypothetical protein